MPYELKRLPLSEFTVMYRYWMRMVAAQEGSTDVSSDPKDGTVIE